MSLIAAIAGKVTAGTATILDRSSTPPWSWALGSASKGDLKIDLLDETFGAVCGGTVWGTWNGTTWSVGAAVPLVASLWDVQCISATSVFLVGQDTAGKASVWEWDGATVTKVHTTAAGGVFYRVHGVSAVSIVACGLETFGYGIVHRSTDAGSTWASLSYPGYASVTACFVLADGTVIVGAALGGGGAQDPVRYYDGSWNTISPNPTVHSFAPLGIWADSISNIFVCGQLWYTGETTTYEGFIFRWAGSSWSTVHSRGNTIYADLAKAGSYMWCCGYDRLTPFGSIVRRSDDSGASWPNSETPAATATYAKGVSAIEVSDGDPGGEPDPGPDLDPGEASTPLVPSTAGKGVSLVALGFEIGVPGRGSRVGSTRWPSG